MGQEVKGLPPSQEGAFAQAVASVSLETDTLTPEVVNSIRLAIINKQALNELLDSLNSLLTP